MRGGGIGRRETEPHQVDGGKSGGDLLPEIPRGLPRGIPCSGLGHLPGSVRPGGVGVRRPIAIHQYTPGGGGRGRLRATAATPLGGQPSAASTIPTRPHQVRGRRLPRLPARGADRPPRPHQVRGRALQRHRGTEGVFAPIAGPSR